VIAFTIHEPSRVPATLEARADAVHFIKEGIAWWALFFPFLWLLYHRMWLVLAGFAALSLGLQLALALAELESAAVWAGIGLSILFAVEANDLRRWTLSRRGYRLVGAVTGNDRAECELKYFSSWETPAASTAPPQAAGTAIVPRTNKPPAAGGEDDVIGLFPGTER
jgi:hypothetical protein